MTHRTSVIAAALIVLAVAAMSQPACTSGQAPDYPATMEVERRTATAMAAFQRQDYRMLIHCMTDVARAEVALTATPIIGLAPTPTPAGGLGARQ